MKKPIFSALFGQSNHLQHVIVMMAERYDDSQLSQKTAIMTKEQRRDFVIAERKSFCQASQAQVLDFLDGFKSVDMVSDLKTFWSFNGFSCSQDQRASGLELQRHGLYGQRRHHRPHRHGRQLQPHRHRQQYVGRRQRVPSPRL